VADVMHSRSSRSTGHDRQIDLQHRRMTCASCANASSAS
jgi:hypothetical protein